MIHNHYFISGECGCRFYNELGPVQSKDATSNEIIASPTQPAINMTFTDIPVITVVIIVMLPEHTGLYVHTRQVPNALMYTCVLFDYGFSRCMTRQQTRFLISTDVIIGIDSLSHAQSFMFYVLGMLRVYFRNVTTIRDICNTHWRLSTNIPHL